MIEGMKRYGLNHGQSRGNNVRLAVYEEFESFFANSAEAESAIVMSSGYLAGTAALRFLQEDSPTIWIAPDTHPAILPQELAPDSKQSFESWKADCLEKSNILNPQKILILGNAVDPLKGQIHAYDWLKSIGEKHELSVLIDDSHAFGVIGKGLFGTYASLKNLPAKVLVSGSIGKGLALPAGIILCNQATKTRILQLPIYGGASPCPPGYLQAFLESQNLYQDQKEKLSKNCKFFHQETNEFGSLSGNSAFPVFNYVEDSWGEKLAERGFITSSFHYPTAYDPLVNRIVISGFHLKEDLLALINTLHSLHSQTN